LEVVSAHFFATGAINAISVRRLNGQPAGRPAKAAVQSTFFYRAPDRIIGLVEDRPRSRRLRKLIAFDDDTFAKLKELARDRMASFQELADEAFADLLKKHGVPVDLKDALRKSARLSATQESKADKPRARKSKSR
jgi:hypothetical protein